MRILVYGAGVQGCELAHRLPAVWGLLCPVRLCDFPPHRLEHIRKPPRRELACLDGYRYGTSGNVLVNQPYPSFP